MFFLLKNNLKRKTILSNVAYDNNMDNSEVIELCPTDDRNRRRLLGDVCLPGCVTTWSTYIHKLKMRADDVLYGSHGVQLTLEYKTKKPAERIIDHSILLTSGQKSGLCKFTWQPCSPQAGEHLESINVCRRLEESPPA